MLLRDHSGVDSCTVKMILSEALFPLYFILVKGEEKGYSDLVNFIQTFKKLISFCIRLETEVIL